MRLFIFKLIEGKKVKVSSSALGEQGSPPVVVDTSSILFCFGGAFNGLEKIVAKIFGKKYGLMVNSGSSANFLPRLSSHQSIFYH